MELNVNVDIGKNFYVRTADDIFHGSLRGIIRRDDGKKVLLFVEEKWRILIDENVLSVAEERGKL